MKIEKITIHNYRSFYDITVDLLPYTVIVGQNNVGKSNILRAIELFFASSLRPRLIRRPHFQAGRFRYTRREDSYNYQRDFPVDLQSNPGAKRTSITLSFLLEKNDFDKLGLSKRFNKFKTVRVSKIFKVSRTREINPEYKSDKLTKHELEMFLSWVFKTSDFVRIPSSRASEASHNLLRSFANRIFANLRGSYNVRKNIRSLATKAQQEIKKAEKTILKKLATFIPEIDSLNLELGELPEISDILGISDIKIDDGTLTYLANKGDGVQSLFFIGLMQYASSLKVNRNLIFGIEEPELHLHPEAQEELSKTLRSIAKEHQVVLTTHSPVLVNNSHLEGNIVVKKDKRLGKLEAINTKSMFIIKQVLGVKPSHNLENARLILVVEGETEKRIFEHILKLISSGLKSAIELGELRILHNKGAKGALNSLEYFRRSLQPRIAIFDNDKEGNEAHNYCLEKQILEPRDLFIVPMLETRQETEIEDMFDLRFTLEALKKSFNIVISAKDYEDEILKTGGRHKKPAKWSIVIEHILNKFGKSSQREFVDKVKESLADVIINSLTSVDIPVFLRTVSNRVNETLKIENIQGK